MAAGMRGADLAIDCAADAVHPEPVRLDDILGRTGRRTGRAESQGAAPARAISCSSAFASGARPSTSRRTSPAERSSPKR
jgi:hypothetical protein